MSEEKRETKEALLGELESIKDLLSEDEWDDIPVLSDTISVPPSPVDDDARDGAAPDTDSLSASSPSVEHQMDLMGADAEEIPASDTSDQETDIEDDFNLAAAHIDTPPASENFGSTPADDEDSARSTQSLGLDANQNTDIDAAVDKLDLDLSLDYDDEEDLLLDQSFEEASEFTAAHYTEQPLGDSSTDSGLLEQAFDHANAADKEFGNSDLDLDLDLNLDDSLTEIAQEEPVDATTTAEFDLAEQTYEAPSATEDEELLADVDSEPSADFDNEPAADLDGAHSADIDEEPLAGSTEEPLADSIKEPSEEPYLQPSAEPATNDSANRENATPDIAELVHELEELDQSMMDIAGDADLETDRQASTDDDSAINTEESATPEIIENSEFTKATPAEVEEYQHDAFAHLPADEEPLSPFGPAGVSAIASLSQNYPQENESEHSSVNLSSTDPNLPPGVLPGQQSLFTGDAKTAKSDHPVTQPRGERPTKASGENPFLPKHIRDRLHTNKALVDIIKESPLPPPTATRPLSNQIHDSVKQQLPPELSAERMHDMVEEVMALYMPRIEAELRERLLNEIKLIEPSTEDHEALGTETSHLEDLNAEHKTTPDTDQ